MRVGARASDHPIAGTLNVVLTVAACSAGLGFLWLASHAGSAWVVLAAAAGFSFSNNTVYSLLHECVHGKFHARRSVNEWCGRVLAAMFPTALGFHRVCHLGHHRRNRTEVERFDYYGPEDSRFLKFAQWYGILTGLYWFIPPVGCLLYLLTPRRVLMRFATGSTSKVDEHTGARAMLAGFVDAPDGRIRMEILFSAAFQALFAYALDLSLLGWFACYAAFAVNWSSLQYADHAWSALDVREGAWNLRVNRAVQYVFLNYHHHLAHHQHPEVPWVHIHRFVDFDAPRPSFLRIYLSMWRGPRSLPSAEE